MKETHQIKKAISWGKKRLGEIKQDEKRKVKTDHCKRKLPLFLFLNKVLCIRPYETSVHKSTWQLSQRILLSLNVPLSRIDDYTKTWQFW